MLKKIHWWLIAACFAVSCSHPAEKNSVKILFAGDLLLDRGVRQRIEHSNADSLFTKIKPLFSDADFVVANLECPVTKQVSPINKQFIFRGEPEWLTAVHDAGITHLEMANNHTNDQGRKGIVDTYNNISQHGMTAVGYGENQTSACDPVIIEKNGIRVALFSSALVPLENWSYLPDSPGICQASARDLEEKIRSHKAELNNDYIVVILHWGIEFQTSPMLSQRIQAQALIDAGADAIIGVHPHVIQDRMTYKGKPIYFSIGNFVFDQDYPGSEALVVELKFTDDGMKFSDHEIKIVNCLPEVANN
ncbi:MAG TPA: CapA family protein [Chitinophagales bacterium]|nr:CapA family protein [Chitinophagales bacterium]